MSHWVASLAVDSRALVDRVLRHEVVIISLERIGDHAKNIAESVIYAVKGTDVCHTSSAEVEREVGQDA